LGRLDGCRREARIKDVKQYANTTRGNVASPTRRQTAVLAPALGPPHGRDRPSLADRGALSGDPDTSKERAAQTGEDAATPTSTPTSLPTPDPAEEARAEAAALADDLRYMAAVDVSEDAGLERAAARFRRLGTRALLTAARRALDRDRYEVAKASALDARQLLGTSAVRVVLADANAGIARERAEARERRRQAAIARDLRTCTSAEKGTVRAGAGIPSGCTTFASDLEARRQADEQELLDEQSADSGCAPGYDPCVPPYPPDVNCPDVGPVTVSGPDPHGLDADGDGVACGGD
jgi:hypothetical protein